MSKGIIVVRKDGSYGRHKIAAEDFDPEIHAMADTEAPAPPKAPPPSDEMAELLGETVDEAEIDMDDED